MTLNAKLFEKLKKRKENGGKVSRKKKTVYICRFGVHFMNRTEKFGVIKTHKFFTYPFECFQTWFRQNRLCPGAIVREEIQEHVLKNKKKHTWILHESNVTLSQSLINLAIDRSTDWWSDYWIEMIELSDWIDGRTDEWMFHRSIVVDVE